MSEKENVLAIPLKPKKIQLEMAIKQRAENDDNIVMTRHASERMTEREIFTEDVIRVLRKGMVIEEPFLNKNGKWEVVMEHRLKGERAKAVVTLVHDKSERLKVVTVMYKDE